MQTGLNAGTRWGVRAGKTAALLTTGVLLAGGVFGVVKGSDPTATALMLLFIGTAFVSILGQQLTRHAPLSLAMTLIILVLSLGTLAGNRAGRTLFLGGILSVVGVLVFAATRRRMDPLALGSAAAFALALVSLAVSSVASGTPVTLLQFIAYASLLPLFPLQGAFVGAVSRLPGTLPAFLAVVLPCLGWHGMRLLVPDVPTPVLSTVGVLALVGALYEALRGAVQFHLPRMIASITTILLSVVWWHIAVSQEAVTTAGWYLGTVSLAASGLLLAGHLLQAQYGCSDLDKLTGLARPMPRFATSTGLLLLAAMGLPLFGNFSAFLAMMFRLPSPVPPSAGVVLLIWLIASVLLMKLLQRLLCGQPRPVLVYRDVGLAELLPLMLMIGLLVLSVHVPVDEMQRTVAGIPATVARGAP